MSSSPTPREQSAAHTFAIHLGNSLDDLMNLNKWVETITTESNLPRDLSFKLHLILEEAIANTIRHGFADDQTGCIEVLLSTDGNQVHLEIKDDGIPFNPLKDHDVILPSSLEDCNIGGLGIHLIKSYTDSIDYQYSENKNILRMLLSTQSKEA